MKGSTKKNTWDRPSMLYRFLLFLGMATVAVSPAFSQESSSTPAPVESPANHLTTTQIEDARDKVLYAEETESFVPLVRKLGRNILHDQKDIWMSPLRMNGDNAKLWLGFAGVTAGLLATDQWTTPRLRSNEAQMRWGHRVSYLGAPYTLLPLVAGFYTYGAAVGDPKARETAILGAEALINSLVVSHAIKSVTRRTRPNGASTFTSGGTSFPSGHAMQSWSLASVIAHEYQNTKWVPVLAYGLAGAVSASRFAAKKHFASDIVVGAGVGWFIGRYVYKTHKDHKIHKQSFVPQFVPTVDPATRTYAIGVAWGR
jgi:membrane-associated phospholipid phosphatase